MAVYACADLHSRYDLFQQIKNFIKPEDIVYVLGDCADRGEGGEGWNIIKEVYNNPQFKFIKGNHEDMLAQAMLGDTADCFYNGGKPTFKAWNEDGADMEWRFKLNHLPTELHYTNKDGKDIILVHAGYTPHKDVFVWNDDRLWSRKHFVDKWDEDFPNTIIVHGHTGCPLMFHYMYDDFPETYNFKDPDIIFYADNHKVNIDLTSAFTGKAALLNLDTFEVKYFYDDMYDKYLEELKPFESREIDYWD